MSEPIPESIPTSADPRSQRPTKKRALTPRDSHAASVDALFVKPDRDITIPGSGPKKTLAPPPEIVANVQGSSAGAGSGEFHVYKASRRREYERLRLMDEENKKEEDERAFAERKAERDRLDREKTEKARLKREKARARKDKKKLGDKAAKQGAREGSAAPADSKIKKLAPSKPAVGDNDADKDVGEGGEVKNADEIGLVIHDDD